MKKSLKKPFVIVLALTLCIGTSAMTFADSGADELQISAEKEATIVEDVVGVAGINNNMTQKKTGFCFEGENSEISVPKKGNKEVILGENGANNKVNMGLPEVVKDVEGVVTQNGTVVYSSESEDVTVSVQALLQESNGVVFDGLRTMITIKNYTAPKTYDFDFNLPEGYSLIEDYDYHDEFNEFDCGQVFVLDTNGDIVNTIDPAWAKDANGTEVETHYTVSGSILTQVILYDEDAVFPIVADPTSHPTLEINKGDFTKAQAQKIKDRLVSEKWAYDIFSMVVGGVTFVFAPGALIGSSNFQNIIDKYTWAIAKTTKTYPNINIHDIRTWRNRGKNSGYLTTDQKLSVAKG